MEAILEETNQFENVKYMTKSCPRPSALGMYHEATREGQIGADVHFTVDAKHRARGHSRYVDNGVVDLTYRDGKKLGRISMKGEFASKSGHVSEKPSVESELAVFSPRWEAETGVMTAIDNAASMLSDLIKPLKVYHAKDETANAVIDHLYDSVVRSQAKMQAAKKSTKLSQPNIATKADLTKDSGREL